MAVEDKNKSTLEFQLFDFDKKRLTRGEMIYSRYSLSQRIFRSLAYFTIFLGLALGAVFIPILHFILVPSFSIVAVLSGFLMFFDKEKILSFCGACPYCENTTVLKGSMEMAEQRCSCDHCRQLIFLQIKN